MTTIDKNSIRVSKTGDASVYRIDFDFTDDDIVGGEGWTATWLHTTFTSGLNVSTPEFESAGLAAMESARRPIIETNFELSLRSLYGESVIRSDPNIISEPQKVQIMAVGSTVIFKTEVV